MSQTRALARLGSQLWSWVSGGSSPLAHPRQAALLAALRDGRTVARSASPGAQLPEPPTPAGLPCLLAGCRAAIVTRYGVLLAYPPVVPDSIKVFLTPRRLYQ